MNDSHRFLLPAVLVTLSLLSCSEEPLTAVVKQEPATRPTSEPTTRDTSQDTERFVRFVDEGDGEGRLETAIVTYRDPKGRQVDLVSAVHVADRVYYERLQKRFESYDAVLYEMVKPKDMRPTPQNTSGGGMLSFFQRKLKTVLDLDFQLDAIRYTEPNFVHADLDVETFAKLTEDRGENIVALLLKSMAEFQRKQRQQQKQTGKEPPPPLGFAHLFAAFMSEDSSRLLKHLLARQLHQVEQALAGLSEGKGSVLLTERNKRCVTVLRERLETGDKQLGIFYGGAHMPDLEKRLVGELGFKKVGERWITAWDIKKK